MIKLVLGSVALLAYTYVLVRTASLAWFSGRLEYDREFLELHRGEEYGEEK